MLKTAIFIALGLLGGGAEFFFLRRITESVIQHGKIKVLFILLFAFLPMLLLLPVAFISPSHLLRTGTAMAAVLIISAIISFIVTNKKKVKK